MLGATNLHTVAVARIAFPLVPGGASVHMHVAITDYVLILWFCAHIRPPALRPSRPHQTSPRRTCSSPRSRYSPGKCPQGPSLPHS